MNRDLKKIIDSLRELGYEDPASHLRACWNIIDDAGTSAIENPHAHKLIARIVEVVARSAENPVPSTAVLERC